MNFIRSILENLSNNMILIDELGNKVWSNSPVSNELQLQKISKDGIIKCDEKYYEPMVKDFQISKYKYYLIEYIDITKYILREEELKKDYLTKLFNREKIMEELYKINSKTLDDNSIFSVILGDIDYFKKINDKFGHINGDKSLIHISNILKCLVGEKGIVGRFGGEEFIIILPNVTSSEAFEFVEYIRSELKNNPFVIDGESLNITMSFGISSSNGKKNIQNLINEADIALYSGKNNGRNKAYIYENGQNR